MIDTLHTIDLGVCAHVVGHILWLCGVRRNVFGGGAQADRIRKMEQNLKQWYKDTRCENQIQGELTPQRVRTTSDWPKVKAKAAQTRALAHYALYLVTTFGNMDNEEEKLAMGVATRLVEFYTIMSAEDMFFVRCRSCSLA